MLLKQDPTAAMKSFRGHMAQFYWVFREGASFQVTETSEGAVLQEGPGTFVMASFLRKHTSKPGIVAHTFDPSTRQTNAGRSL